MFKRTRNFILKCCKDLDVRIDTNILERVRLEKEIVDNNLSIYKRLETLETSVASLLDDAHVALKQAGVDVASFEKVQKTQRDLTDLGAELVKNISELRKYADDQDAAWYENILISQSDLVNCIRNLLVKKIGKTGSGKSKRLN